MKAVFLTLFAIVVLLFLCLYFLQGKLIYFPRRYYETYAEVLKEVDQVQYQLKGKRQIAFLLKRNSNEAPEKIWWFFGGNGSLALNWVALVEKVGPEHPETAFVLVDYPGYGFSKGSPHPKRIRESVDRLHEKLAQRWEMDADELNRRSSAIGHSLGAAVALDTANRFDFSRVVAISPFTTMKAMAHRQMGGLGSSILSHHYDNETSLDGLLSKENKPEIIFFHGDSDTLIPYSMSQALLARSPQTDRIAFTRARGAGHNNVIAAIESDLLKILKGEESPKIHLLPGKKN